MGNDTLLTKTAEPLHPAQPSGSLQNSILPHMLLSPLDSLYASETVTPHLLSTNPAPSPGEGQARLHHLLALVHSPPARPAQLSGQEQCRMQTVPCFYVESESIQISGMLARHWSFRPQAKAVPLITQ